MRTTGLALTIATVLGLTAAGAQAHFRLLEPASWIEEDDLGDPQKLAPCGGTIGDAGVRTGDITEVQGGQALRVVVEEAVFHPGHYRIALARRPNWLPADPVVTLRESERGLRSADAEIADNPEPPVLVDGLWPHDERPTGNWETEITIPNIDCENCFLQVIQFMAEHPGVREGGFSYHHCAVLNISADTALPIDARWSPSFYENR